MRCWRRTATSSAASCCIRGTDAAISEIGGDALHFPVAVAGGVEPAAAVGFLRRRRLAGARSATDGGLGERPLGRGGKRLTRLGRRVWGGWRRPGRYRIARRHA